MPAKKIADCSPRGRAPHMGGFFRGFSPEIPYVWVHFFTLKETGGEKLTAANLVKFWP